MKQVAGVGSQNGGVNGWSKGAAEHKSMEPGRGIGGHTAKRWCEVACNPQK